MTTVVAGETDKHGSTDNLLNTPGNLYVHATDGIVYVADRLNNRIQKWSKNATKGITVAGLSNSTSGINATSLNSPYAVLVDDETGVIYVADSFNNRVQRWLSNALEGDTIAGGFGMYSISLNSIH
jgi:DNA-binding beta-propeller fold protein YncE